MAVLEIKDLKKSFPSPEGPSQAILDVPLFQLNDGEHVALKGSSGTGKTTLLNLIAGILLSDEGTIIVAGEDVTQLTESQRDLHRARFMGYVFQTFNLLQGYTALENVTMGMMFGAGVDSARAEDLLRRVGLEDRMHYLPRQLSVGQQQRVAVARSLANRPKLVLADEPTGNLDRQHALSTINLIRKICQEEKAALLLVTHDPFVLDLFERVEDLSRINRIGSSPEIHSSKIAQEGKAK